MVRENHPEHLDALAKLVQENRIELQSGAFYEPIMPSIPDRDKDLQITKLNKYIENDSDDLHSFSIDIKDFDTPLINIKYDKKKLKIVSKYINIYDNKNEPKNHVAYKLIDLCKFELYEIFDFLIKHK